MEGRSKTSRFVSAFVSAFVSVKAAGKARKRQAGRSQRCGSFIHARITPPPRPASKKGSHDTSLRARTGNRLQVPGHVVGWENPQNKTTRMSTEILLPPLTHRLETSAGRLTRIWFVFATLAFALAGALRGLVSAGLLDTGDRPMPLLVLGVMCLIIAGFCAMMGAAPAGNSSGCARATISPGGPIPPPTPISPEVPGMPRAATR